MKLKSFYHILLSGFFVLGLTQCHDKKTPLPGERHSLLEAVNILAKDPDADNFAIFLPEAKTITEWGQMGGNKAHCMSHGRLEGDERKVIWSESIGNGTSRDRFLLAGPVGAAGVIYTIDVEGRVQAREAKTGKLAWSYATENKDKKSFHSGGGVAVKGNKVFVATPYGEMIALEKDTGFEIWRSDLPFPARSAPAVDQERVYVTTMNNRSLAFDAVTGKKVWQHEGATETTSLVGGAAPAIYGRVVFVPYSTGELFALKAENGHFLWSETLSSLRTLSSTAGVAQVRARPVIYKGMVLALAQGDRMMAIDFRTGRRLWDKEIGGIRTPAVTDEFIFALTNDHQVTCLIRETGQVAWVKELKDPDPSKSVRWAGPTLAGGGIVLAGSNGQVVFLNPENGDIDKTISVSDPVALSPIVLDGVLYILTDRGRLVAVQ
jgi:outer membrane protein assembly factor BamB